MDLQELIDHLFMSKLDSNLAKVLISFQLLPLLVRSGIMELKVELSVFVLIIVCLSTYVRLIFTGQSSGQRLYQRLFYLRGSRFIDQSQGS